MLPVAKWIDLGDGTSVKRVPGGMVLRYGDPVPAMVFIACPGEMYAAFLEGHDVDLDALMGLVVPKGPRIVTPS